MLDRSKLIVQLDAVLDTLLPDNADHHEQLLRAWQRIAADPLFEAKVRQAAHEQLPLWRGLLQKQQAVARQPFAYRIAGVDGSQIYPDRHQGNACFLINIGTVFLSYGTHDQPAVRLHSSPTLFTSGSESAASSLDYVNCVRQELELHAGMRMASVLSAQPDAPALVLFDGTLIFWYLDLSSNPSGVQGKAYFAKYCAILDDFYKQETLVASYISMPRSRELVQLVAFAHEQQLLDPCFDESVLERITDSAIATVALEPHHRSTVFQNNAPVAGLYPRHLTPHFFYMHAGDEIGRVEIPAWIAADNEKVDAIAAMVLDQVCKGNGYPVCLAEAHEQAVVKGADRDFFYHLLAKRTVEKKQRLQLSQKLRKKKSMAV